jgi:hypothetical protein
MKSYIVYGISEQPGDKLRSRLNATLGVVLVAHESSYRGVYYRAGSTGEEHIILQPNHLPQDDEWIDEEHKEYPVLLYVNETLRPDEFDKLLSGEIPSLKKLKREDL